MKDLQNFYLNYFNGTLCKRSVLDSKNYFYNFFGTNSDSAKEEVRLLELKNQLTDFSEKKMVNESLSKVKIINTRNYHIIRETEDVQNYLLENNLKYDLLQQAVWLCNLLKYYPEQEKYILKDYGEFVLDTAKFLNSKNTKVSYEYIKLVLNFGDEYKDAILFAIRALGDKKCNLINEKKVNHALQVGLETYFMGSLKNDAVVAAILLDVLQYSPKYDYIKDEMEKLSIKYNSKKILDIFVKSGLEPNILNKTWSQRKKYQIDLINTPGLTSFSALTILIISKKINLSEISNYFKKLRLEYINSNTNATNNMINSYMKKMKTSFWYEYSEISEKDAKEYYSKIFYSCLRIGYIPSKLLDTYENFYYSVFNEFPA